MLGNLLNLGHAGAYLLQSEMTMESLLTILLVISKVAMLDSPWVTHLGLVLVNSWVSLLDY